MDIEALIAQLPDMRTAAATARAEANAAYSKAERLDRAIESIEALADDSPAIPAATVVQDESAADVIEQLTGIEAVRRVIRESPDRRWRSAEVYRILRARGWVSPGNQNPSRSTAVALQRMAVSGEILKVGRGEFMLPADDQD